LAVVQQSVTATAFPAAAAAAENAENAAQ